ncbi:MAG: molybdopterin-dependent oxidoreductase [Acidimicrobiales bacterium]
MSTTASATERVVHGACPLDCPDACSWLVTVDADGRATKLRGNPEHPFTRGGLCKKVNPWLDFAADPGRLLHPMRRVGAKGEGRFEPISWDDAIAEMAERFGAIIEASGGEAIWPFPGTGNVGWIHGSAGPRRLWQHLGASNHQISICSISGHVGLGYTTGTAAGLDPEEVVDAGVVLIWGSNTLVSNQHWWPFVEQARVNGAEVVVIDPINNRTAQRADRHLAPIPGTDGALALGLCKALIDDGHVDKAFIGDQTAGFDEFAGSLGEWTIERTAEVTGIDPDAIRSLVALLGETVGDEGRGPLCCKLGQGMQRHAGGGQAARVVSCLPAILGAYGRSGGGLVYSTGDGYQLAPFTSNAPVGKRPRLLATTNLGKNLASLDDPPVEAIVFYGANPMVSNPELELVRRGLEREDLFTVVIDLYQTETADYADLLLPSTMQHEQFELHDSFAHLYLNWNEPAVEAPGSCLPHTEIFRRLATAMGLDDPELHLSDLEIAASLLDTDAYREAGITLERLRSDGWVRVPDSSPFRPFADGFKTASRRFEFASSRAEADGQGRVPHYLPAAETTGEPEPGRYRLVSPASEWHINSVFAGTAVNLGRTVAPPVSVHPDDAERDGLVDGQPIVIENQRGTYEAVVRVDDRIRPGLAATTKGWWRQGLNATVREQDSDMGRGAVYHDNAVTIRPR